MSDKTYNTAEAVKAQIAYCDRTEQPCFIPESGWCCHCGGNIFGEKGVSIEDAGKRLVTGCPFCGATFVE